MEKKQFFNSDLDRDFQGKFDATGFDYDFGICEDLHTDQDNTPYSLYVQDSYYSYHNKEDRDKDFEILTRYHKLAAKPMEKYFQNGFQSYIETYFEVCRNLFDPHNVKARTYEDINGGAALQELATEITDCFENFHAGREWQGEFIEEIDEYVYNYLQNTSSHESI